MSLPRVLLSSCLVLPALVHAEAAHEHGIGQLDIAVEGKTVDIQLSGPGHNFVGFEHEAETAAERQAITDARAKLNDAAKLFGGLDGCKATVKIDAPEADHAGHEHDHDHDHAKEDHKHDDHTKAHKHDDDHDHDHDHGHDHDHDHAHNDWTANYQYTCEATPTGSVELNVFALFPQTNSLRWQAVTPTGQTGGVATTAQPTIQLP